MGNDSSLPSLDRMGRPFGTERSPIRSFSNQVNRQLQTGNPVERLEGSREAGGSRRARKNEQPGSRRGRRGPRAEEVRAERQAQGKVSRRESENSSRARKSESRGQLSKSAARPAPGDDGTAQRPDFGERLRAKSDQPVSRAKTAVARPDSPEDATFAKTSQAKPQAAVGLGAPINTIQQAVPTGGPNAGLAGAGFSAAAKPAALPAAATVPLSAQAEAAKGGEAKPAEAAAPEPATRWSETEAAERASAVLRQLRVNLNPTLRTATIQLAPADLGRLSIKLRVEDGRVFAVVRAESAETLAILERHMPELQASLASQGLEAESFELELGFGEEQRGTEHGGGVGASAAAPTAEAEESAIDPNLLARAVAQRSGLDTYA